MKPILFEPGMIPEAGKCYSGMSNDDYHHVFVEWFSSSDLKNALRSASYFWQEYKRKKEQEKKEYKVAFENGSAFHDALESLIVHDDLRLFEQNTVSYEGTAQAKKKFMDAKSDNPGKNVVPISMYENIPIMAEKTKSEADELDIFESGEVELAFFWIDPSTGIKLKVKTDYTRFDNAVVVDFKTTKNHREKEFSKDLANYGYHFSAAMYLEGIRQVTGLDMDWFFIATNNTAPFEVAIYYLDELSLKEGAFLLRNVLNDLHAPKKKPEFKKIGVPMWAITHFDKEY